MVNNLHLTVKHLLNQHERGVLDAYQFISEIKILIDNRFEEEAEKWNEAYAIMRGYSQQ